MKYYSSDEYQHCLEAVKRYTGGVERPGLHELLMEQRDLMHETAYRSGYQAGKAAEHDRLTDGDWNQHTAANMANIRAAEKWYRGLLDAAALVDNDPERALQLVRQWNQDQAAINQEFEQFMGSLNDE